MFFCEQLNKYIKQIECSSKELVNASGLSTSVISRYRNGERTPNIKSKQLESLSNGLHKISIDKKVNISKEEMIKIIISKNNTKYSPESIEIFNKISGDIK